MTGSERDLPADLVGEVVDVLTDVPRWRLTPARWALAGEVIERMGEAVEAGDVAALDRASAELELLAPVQHVPIGTTPSTPPPPRVRERVYQLVHDLSPAGSPPPRGADADPRDRQR